jgi:hypothetical protein
MVVIYTFLELFGNADFRIRKESSQKRKKK